MNYEIEWLYQEWSRWRVRLYDAMARGELSTDALRTIPNDLAQTLGRVEAEVKRREDGVK